MLKINFILFSLIVVCSFEIVRGRNLQHASENISTTHYERHLRVKRNACENGRIPPYCCDNGSASPYCCDNGSESPYCCDNGSRSPYCCANGSFSPYCCGNESQHETCS